MSAGGFVRCASLFLASCSSMYWVSRAAAKRTTGVSKSRENVRSSVQRKYHSVMPRWYQMMTPWEPPGIVALEDPRHPGIS